MPAREWSLISGDTPLAAAAERQVNRVPSKRPRTSVDVALLSVAPGFEKLR